MKHILFFIRERMGMPLKTAGLSVFLRRGISISCRYVGVCAANIAGIQELDEERWQPSTCKKLPYSIKDGDRELYHLQLDGLEGGDGYDQAEG